MGARCCCSWNPCLRPFKESTLEIQRVVQDEPPQKKERKRGRCLVAPSYDTLLAKKTTKSIGSTPYFFNIKYVFIFEMASIS